MQKLKTTLTAEEQSRIIHNVDIEPKGDDETENSTLLHKLTSEVSEDFELNTTDALIILGKAATKTEDKNVSAFNIIGRGDQVCELIERSMEEDPKFAEMLTNIVTRKMMGEMLEGIK